MNVNNDSDSKKEGGETYFNKLDPAVKPKRELLSGSWSPTTISTFGTCAEEAKDAIRGRGFGYGYT